VAIATGFTSHSYFAQSYRQQFGRPPSEERRTTY
jgi:transcriptional regulator GlxA family with amidase domain